MEQNVTTTENDEVLGLGKVADANKALISLSCIVIGYDRP